MSLTRYRSRQTILTANIANSLYGGLYGSPEAEGLSDTDPLVAGHVHDGEHADGHVQKINLGEHTTGQLDGENFQNYSIEDVKFVNSLSSGGYSPINATYIVTSLNSILTDERVLAVSSGELTINDGGAEHNLTLGLETTAVTPGSYTSADLTVDEFGRITAISNGTVDAPSSAGYVVLSLNATLTNERVLSIDAGELTLTDNGAGNTVSLGLATTAVTPGSYTYSSLTVDSFGRITAASNGSLNAAPVNATYVVISNNATLTNERALGVDAGELALTDGGANSSASLGLATTTVTPGSYSLSSITVDSFGRITAASNGGAAGGGAFLLTSGVTSNSPGTLGTDDFVFGSNTLVDDGNSVHDNRFLFDKNIAAFRAGTANGTEWDSLGAASVAFGANVNISSTYCFGSGSTNTISGSSNYASVLGGNNNTITVGGASSILGGSNSTINSAGRAIIAAATSSTINSGAVGADHSIILGASNSTIAASTISEYSTIVAGDSHILNSSNSLIVGGDSLEISNILSSHNVAITGESNSITSNSDYNGIFGGDNHSISVGGNNNISGGSGHTISAGSRNSILGGNNHIINSVGADGHTMLGGNGNTIDLSGDYCSVIGGSANEIDGSGTGRSNIIGGNTNNISVGSSSGIYAGLNNSIGGTATIGNAILGGNGNVIDTAGDYNLALGGLNEINDDGDESNYNMVIGKSGKSWFSNSFIKGGGKFASDSTNLSQAQVIETVMFGESTPENNEIVILTKNGYGNPVDILTPTVEEVLYIPENHSAKIFLQCVGVGITGVLPSTGAAAGYIHIIRTTGVPVGDSNSDVSGRLASSEVRAIGTEGVYNGNSAVFEFSAGAFTDGHFFIKVNVVALFGGGSNPDSDFLVRLCCSVKMVLVRHPEY